MDMNRPYDAFKVAFDGAKQYPDDKPLVSDRHPTIIGGIEVKGDWLDLYDLLHDKYWVWSDDADGIVIRDGYEERDWELARAVFTKVFLGNKA